MQIITWAHAHEADHRVKCLTKSQFKTIICKHDSYDCSFLERHLNEVPSL